MSDVGRKGRGSDSEGSKGRFAAAKWARDFADKLRQRGITTEQVLRTASLQSFIVLYWHKERAAIGFWHPDIRLVAVWSPLRKGRWVTAFRRSLNYLLEREGCEVLWHPETR